MAEINGKKCTPGLNKLNVIEITITLSIDQSKENEHSYCFFQLTR